MLENKSEDNVKDSSTKRVREQVECAVEDDDNDDK